MFGGEWMDNIKDFIEMDGTDCSICGVDEYQDNRVYLSAMLKVEALNYYNNNLKDISSYAECVQRVFQVYTSDEQRNRLLQEWHGTTLSSLMALDPEKPRIEVFKNGLCSIVRYIEAIAPRVSPRRILKRPDCSDCRYSGYQPVTARKNSRDRSCGYTKNCRTSFSPRWIRIRIPTYAPCVR